MKKTKIFKKAMTLSTAMLMCVPMFAQNKDDIVINDNLISNYNPNFEDGPSKESLYWWNDASWSQNAIGKVSYVAGETNESSVLGNYMVIRPSDAGAVAQICAGDLAGKFVPGLEYSFTYYVKLQENKSDANVQLVVKGIKADWSSQIDAKVKLSKEYKLSTNWQKVTGSFILDNPMDQVMIQFVGTGNVEVCVDDLRICATRDVIPLEIEKDIKSLKSVVSSSNGLGKDIIVGTEINTQEYVDQLYFDLSAKHFNAVTLGNELKPDCMNGYHNGNTSPIGLTKDTLNGKEMTVPVLDYSRANNILDKIVAHNKANPNDELKVRGHVLVWHSQTPEWFFHKDYDASKEYVSKEEMTERQEWYIKTVLEYYTSPNTETGKKYGSLFYGWDVVNEACTDNGYRTDVENGPDTLEEPTHGNKSSWYHVYQSQEYIINAFRFANKYAPASLKLFYNDYGECSPKKKAAIINLIKDVKAAEGTRLDGMGMQAHYDMTNPTINQFETALKDYTKAAGSVMITEFDIKGITDDLEGAYRFKAFYDSMKKLQSKKQAKITGVTFWGTMDKYSWLQSSSNVGGGADGSMRQKPLLFNDNYKAKEAYLAFAEPKKLPPLPVKKEVKKVDSKAAKGTPVVDGTMESAWNKATEYTLAVNNKSNATAKARVLWDNEYLYVFVNVTDAELNKDNANEYEQDSIEVFIDENNHKTEEYEADDKQYRINFDNFQSFNGQKCVAENVKSATKITENGYCVEAAFKWTDITPKKNAKIGFDLQINDAGPSGSRRGTLNLYDSTGNGWQWTSIYGTLILK